VNPASATMPRAVGARHLTISSLITRLAGTATFWIRNGKRFNLVVFLAAAADAFLSVVAGRVIALAMLLWLAAAVGVASVFASVVSAQFGSALVSPNKDRDQVSN